MRVAAIDLGTNSFHMLVAEVAPDGHLDPIVQEKEMLRLGDVVSRHGVIPETAADQVVGTIVMGFDVQMAKNPLASTLTHARTTLYAPNMHARHGYDV